MPEPPAPRRSIASFLRPLQEAAAASDTVTSTGPADPIAAGAVHPPSPDAAATLLMSSTLPPSSGHVTTDTIDEAAALPAFLRPRQRAPGWHWGVIIVLVVVLALQAALSERARLAADPAMRPWISSACALLGCSLPAWREPKAYTMTARDVRPLPAQPGNLQVRASIRNDARWEQAWPDVKLSLSDADGRVLGSRVFTARDYLDDPTIAGQPLGPGQSAQLAFIVRDPAATTAAFAFEFL